MEIQTIRTTENLSASKGDRKSCTINALSCSAEIPFDIAQQIGFKAGRKINRGFYGKDLLPVAKRYGVKYRKMRFKRMTLQKFIKTYPTGKFYVETNRHAFAVINGVVNDWLVNKAGCIILVAYEILSSGTNGRQIKITKPKVRKYKPNYRVKHFDGVNVLGYVSHHKTKGDAIRTARKYKKMAHAVVVHEVSGVFDITESVIYFSDMQSRLKYAGIKKPTKTND